MRILVTGAGGAAAVSVWKSLNADHALYMGDIDPCAAGLYLVPAERRMLLPKGKSQEFVSALLEMCDQHQIEVLIATVDDELAPLAAASEQFAALGVKLPLCSEAVLRMCRDKYALLSHCKDKIPVPEFVLLTPETKNTITTFPCFAKPRLGAGSSGIFTIENAQGLKVLPEDASYLIQELLPGEEYSVDVYIHSSGRPIAAVPRLRMKIDSGIAVTARTQHLPELSHLAVEVATHVGIRYVANVQFKLSIDGKYKLLEINPRFPGTLPLTAAAGIDIAQLLIQDIQGKPLPESLMPFAELMVVRYWTEHFCSPKEWEALCQKR